jgi:FkbM family methyltransferase
MERNYVRLKAVKGERICAHVRTGPGKVFSISLAGPSQISAVLLKEERMALNDASLADWYRDRGDENHNVDYPLTENSVVVEVGCYRGLWVSRMAAKYNCNFVLFEPVKEFFEDAVERFKDNSKIVLFDFGLSNFNGEIEFDLMEDRSRPGEGKYAAPMRDVAEVITTPIDLININIEGGEYTLLERMIESGVAKLCRNIQVQFHDDYPNCIELRDKIREGLAKTHIESYVYPFVWESWRLK